MMKKWASVVCVLLVAILLVTGSVLSSEAAPRQMNIGTASMGGAYYPFGQAIANLVTKYSGNLVITPEVTGGAVENCRLLDNGDIDIGLTNENYAYAAVNAVEQFAGKKIDLNVIGRFYPSILHIMTLEGSSINSIADLKGKRVAVGPAGGGAEAPLAAVFKAYGMTIADVTASYLSYNDGFTQLADGNVDVALALAGYPTSAVMEISATQKVKFINIEDDKMGAIIAESPYFAKVVIPPSLYNTAKEGVVVGINNVLIVRADMEEDVAYAITKSIFDHLEEFAAANANAKDTTIDSARNASVTIHPGAQKYYDEHK